MIEQDCQYCGTPYTPYGRMAKRQKVCGDPECVAKHKRAMDRRWWAASPERRRRRNEKKCTWANKRGYWREYRAKNPKYAARNRVQSRERMKERRALAVLMKRPVEYLEGLRGSGGEMFANQELLAKIPDGEQRAPPCMFANQELLNWRVDGTLRYLKAQAMFANFKSMDTGGSVGVK